MKFNTVYISFINLIGISHHLGVVKLQTQCLSASVEKLKMILGDTNLEKNNKVPINGEKTREIEYGNLVNILRSCANYNQLNGN